MEVSVRPPSVDQDHLYRYLFQGTKYHGGWDRSGYDTLIPASIEEYNRSLGSAPRSPDPHIRQTVTSYQILSSHVLSAQITSGHVESNLMIPSHLFCKQLKSQLSWQIQWKMVRLTSGNTYMGVASLLMTWHLLTPINCQGLKHFLTFKPAQISSLLSCYVMEP